LLNDFAVASIVYVTVKGCPSVLWKSNTLPVNTNDPVLIGVLVTLTGVLVHDLNMVYQELKGNIVPFLKLYRSVKVAGIDVQHLLNLLKIVDNNNLPALEYKYEILKQEVDSLDCRKSNSKNTLQALTKTLDSCRLSCKELMDKIDYLQNKKIALEDLVARFENNNEEYLKI
jgi:hypothetical protein